LKTIKVDYETIHKIVEDNKNAMWDGWTAVFLRPNRNAYTQKKGMFYKGRWNVVVLRSNPDSNGLWEVPINV
jgi:phage I-like protein